MPLRTKALIALAAALVFCGAGASWARQIAGPGGSVSNGAIRILSPKPGARISVTFVDLKFELVAGNTAASSPSFRIQLDARDPIITTETERAFTGLRLGKHSILIQVVDANERPLPGLSAQVNFLVVRPSQAGSGPTSSVAPAAPSGSARIQPVSYQTSGGEQLPTSSSDLPLISVIGFGVLVGGILSARWTRPRGSK